VSNTHLISALRQRRGMVLLELLVAMLIATFLVLGLVQIVSAARSSYRLQESLAAVQENSRFAVATIAGIIRDAGFHPEPWVSGDEFEALTGETQDGVTASGDRLALGTWSDRNCFGNLNTVLDVSARPAFYLKQSVLELNTRRDLVHTCRYGPDSGQLRTQIRRQGLIQNVESFQALYAEDRDRDGNAERWVRGGSWLEENQVLGIRIGLLLAGREPVLDPATRVFSILDTQLAAPSDGKLRRDYSFAAAIRSRSR
jgi:type II secretory pathway component PulJ